MAQQVTTQTGQHGTVTFDGKQKVREGMRILVSLFLLTAGIVIVSSHNFPDSTKCVAVGWIGAVIGYWLS